MVSRSMIKPSPLGFRAEIDQWELGGAGESPHTAFTLSQGRNINIVEREPAWNAVLARLPDCGLAERGTTPSSCQRAICLVPTRLVFEVEESG